MAVVSSITRGWQATRRTRIRSVRYHLDLASNLVGRDVKARYKGSFLGMLWSLMQPLSLIAVYSFLFTRVISLDIPNYVPFLVVGILPWNWFAASLDFSADCLLANRDLIKKAVFPNEILPVAAVTSNLLILALAVPVVLVFILVSGIRLTPVALLVPAIVVLQYAFTVGLALVVSTLNVFFRDIRHLLGVLLFAWFFLTPVFYDAALVPTAYRSLYSANPMAHFISSYRDVLLFGKMPSLSVLMQLTLASTLALAIGLAIFSRYKRSFPEEM